MDVPSPKLNARQPGAKRRLKRALLPVLKPALDRLLLWRGAIMARTGWKLRSGGFMVAHTAGRGLGLFVTRAYAPGERVIAITGEPVAARGEYTIQTGPDAQLYPSAPLRYANHSCEPNVGIRSDAQGQPAFHAMRALRAGEEVLWDYCMSELELVIDGKPAGFTCRCGAPGCRGEVAGWRHAPAEVQQRYREWIMPYLRDRDGT
ncbi:MAG TPA: SET domain-containing protein-lysine N-methyltransferase [Steroidobacteraceae bacterium]|nr:SET domain-containing protein-lysine N-methyltransferase [Steroidobacteraceae bacterium]